MVPVIMRTKNSGGILEQTLKALFSQEAIDFELLIVDSGSTDNTLEIARRYPHRLIEIEASSYFPGKVLNRAIEATEGEIVVFLNSDTVLLRQDALHLLLDAMQDGAVAAFGRQVARPDAETWVQRDYAVAFPSSGPAPEWLPLSLPFAAMRRSIWEQHHFYIDAWGSEDTEWGTWARAQGYEVRYVANAIAMHSHNYSLRGLYGRRFIEGEADAFIYGDSAHFSWIRRVLADFKAHVAARDPIGLAKAPIRRAVEAWAYKKGWAYGQERKDSANTDASLGQRVVLDRHE